MCIRERCYGNLTVSEVYEYDIDSRPEELDAYCSDCDFVFNLAGVDVYKRQATWRRGLRPSVRVPFGDLSAVG